jgi:hydroxyacylglutathione hydrolase
LRILADRFFDDRCGSFAIVGDRFFMIPIEDLFEDIVGKAQRGLGLADSQVAEKAGLTLEKLRDLKAGKGDRKAIAAIAAVLGLNAEALSESFERSWYPEVQAIDSVAQFNSALIDMTVNAYVVWDLETKQAAIFDTGADASELLDFVDRNQLQVTRLFLTHTHGDHVADLEAIRQRTGATVYAPEKEPMSGSEPVREGDQFDLGQLKIEARLTKGHSPGGTTYVVRGLQVPVAIVGDSLFAGSMGGAPNAFRLALENNRNKILSLPPETLICPGHGPLTTVELERRHNPFFA